MPRSHIPAGTKAVVGSGWLGDAEEDVEGPSVLSTVAVRHFIKKITEHISITICTLHSSASVITGCGNTITTEPMDL